ncbi:MAG: protein kinase [Planctomycetes bacterium]|nr:protein kinase [Planctomycetota bacterium]
MVNRCTKCGSEGVTDRIKGACPACLFGELDVPEKCDPLDPGSKFASVEIVKKLGQGGMGVVYLARQPQLDRPVALKILSPALAADPEFRDRFVREAQALAKLNHPNIVHVHDFGERDGLYYLMMEYVEGVNLRTALDSGMLSSEELLRLIPPLCEALESAHAQGTVHRDIKPENILVDRQGRVKITDFGIAKIANPSRKITKVGVALGTPDYMAPEQIEAFDAADHRADLYSLGAVIYEILTGKVPAARFVRPSRIARTDPRFDRLLERTLHRDPERRNVTAKEIAREITVIITTPPSRVIPWRWIAAGLAGVGVVALLLVGRASVPQDAGDGVDAHLRDLADGSLETREGAVAELLKLAEKDRALQDRLLAEGDKAVDPETRALLERIAAHIDFFRAKGMRLVEEGVVSGHTGQAPKAMAISPDGATLATWSWDNRIILHATDDLREVGVVGTTSDSVSCLAFFPDNRMLAVAAGASALILDSKTGMVRHTLKHEEKVAAVCPSGDGERLYTGARDGLRSWNGRTGQLEKHPDTEPVSALELIPDGRGLVTQSGHCTLVAWNPATWDRTVIAEGTGGQFASWGPIAVNKEGTLVAQTRSGRTGSFNVWEIATGRKIHSFDLPVSHGNGALSSPSRELLACSWSPTGYPETAVFRWDDLKRRVHTLPHPFADYVFAADDAHIFLPAEGQLQKVELETQKVVARAEAHKACFWHVAFHPDGELLTCGGTDTLIRCWDPTQACEIGSFVGGRQAIYGFAVSPDGLRLATYGGGDRDELRVFDWKDRSLILAIDVTDANHNGIPLMRFLQGDRLLTVDYWGKIRLYDLRRRLLVKTVELRRMLNADNIDASEDGRLIFVAGRNCEEGSGTTLSLWDIEKGEPVYDEIEEGIHNACLSADGSFIFLVTPGKELQRLTARTRQVVTTVTIDELPQKISIDRSGRLLALIFPAGIKILHAPTLQPIASYDVQGAKSVFFSPDGKRIGVCGQAWVRSIRVEAANNDGKNEAEAIFLKLEERLLNAKSLEEELKERFCGLVKARLAGHAEKVAAFFGETGYDLDDRIEFPVSKIPRKKDRALQDIIEKSAKIDAGRLEDCLDPEAVEVLGFAEAKAKYGETPRLERIFRRGGMKEGDRFLICPLKKDLSPELFFVGVEHTQGHLFYVWRQGKDGWKAIYFVD